MVFAVVGRGFFSSLFFVFYFVCGLYLFGFSFNGVNSLSYVVGGVDFVFVAEVRDVLIPFERVLCGCLGVVCFGLCLRSLWGFCLWFLGVVRG